MKPTRDELERAYGKRIPDVIAPDLGVLFVGINPGLYSGATGRHFAKPGNRFWPVIHRAGFTPRQLDPSENRELLECGCGVTNVVNFTTARADELTTDQLIAGARNLTRKVRRYRPRYVAILGLTTYRIAFGRKKATIGEQGETLGDSHIWLLPNPSGLNAHYQLPDLTELFQELHAAAFGDRVADPPVTGPSGCDPRDAG